MTTIREFGGKPYTFKRAEVKGHKTSKRQHKFLHVHHIKHGHVYCRTCGKHLCCRKVESS